MAVTKKRFDLTDGYLCDSELVKGSSNFVRSGDIWASMLPTTALSITDDYTLKDDEKTAVVAFTCSVASKSIVLGIADGKSCLVMNTGATNAVTVKGLEDDTGTSVGAGKIALVIGSSTANTTSVNVLN